MFRAWMDGSELESHFDIGDHCVKDERPSKTLYDKLRRDWADRFSTSVEVTENEPSEPNIHQSENVSIPALHTVIMGWDPSDSPTRLRNI